ncbi:Conserved phage C-terminus (Phg_2220_C) [Serratia quinivorans]|uniref:Conserved phage C-terminus (Phg_2220_C) n=1 Tax=Serratia quinivorans TaxID=137545 RepID=A0A380AI59_9GAMM|nr:conserved phage C-terminal domain-containing protein [Serratia proteamaculans]RYM64727.1 hypothetical protein BSR03_04240 [Serratia proteamaculans]SUI81103.1 Conserved phage C-terminus (Phg_2220_C) [Serratia quinivorans]
MSIDAMNWAKKIKTGKSSAKSVLTWLADMCGPDHCAFPSIGALADATELDKKTVQSSLQHLIAVGLIEDTGDRRGRTNQIPVYRLVGIEESVADVEHTQKREHYQKRDRLKKPVNNPKKGIVSNAPKNGNVTENGIVKDKAPENGAVTDGETIPVLEGNDPENGIRNLSGILKPKEIPTQTLPAELDSGGEGFRVFLADLLRNQFPATDAATLHDQAVELLSQHGLTCRREFPVDDRGDGRGGEVDILVTDESGRRCGIELDWKSPRRKSITKLNSIGGGLVVLRDVNHRGDYLDSGVLVIGGCKPEVLVDRAGEVLDFLNSKINGRTPKRADTLREITERLDEGNSVDELKLVAEHRVSLLLNNPTLAHMLAPNLLFAAQTFGAYLVAANAWQKKRANQVARVAAVEQQRQSPPVGDVPGIDFEGSFERLFVEGLPPESLAEKLAWENVQKNGFKSPGDEVASRKEWVVILSKKNAVAGRSEA